MRIIHFRLEIISPSVKTEREFPIILLYGYFWILYHSPYLFSSYFLQIRKFLQCFFFFPFNSTEFPSRDLHFSPGKIRFKKKPYFFNMNVILLFHSYSFRTFSFMSFWLSKGFFLMVDEHKACIYNEINK